MANYTLINIEILVSWHTLMLAKQLQQKEYFIIRVKVIKLERYDGAATMDWMEQEQERGIDYFTPQPVLERS